MASDDLWILGIHMTKFGKHPDEDLIDLASEAVLGALADGGVEMKDMGVIGAGSLMAANAGIGQQLQKQIGQTGIPVYNVANACATGATALRVACMAVKSGEAEMALAFGVEKLSGAGLLSGGSRKADATPSLRRDASGRWRRLTVASAPRPCPGCSPRSAWSTATGTGVPASSSSPGSREEPRPLHPQSAGRLHQADDPRRDHGRRHDRLPQHPAHVLGELRRRGCRRGGERRQAQDPVARTATPGGQDLGLGADHRPMGGGVPGPPDVNTLTRNAADQAYEQAGIGPADLDLVELHDCFATAELVHYDNLRLCDVGGAVDFFTSGATWRDGSTPVNVSGGLESKGHPIAATGIANVWEVATEFRVRGGRPPDQRSQGRFDPCHRIGLGLRCAHPGEGGLTFVVHPGRQAIRGDGVPPLRLGLKLPAISLGLWQNFGDARPHDEISAMLTRAFDLGITHFDLANNTGRPRGSGSQLRSGDGRKLPPTAMN